MSADLSDVLAVERRPFCRTAVYIRDAVGRQRTIFCNTDVDLASLRAFKKRCRLSGVAFDGKHLKRVWLLLIARLWRESECATK